MTARAARPTPCSERPRTPGAEVEELRWAEAPVAASPAGLQEPLLEQLARSPRRPFDLPAGRA